MTRRPKTVAAAIIALALATNVRADAIDDAWKNPPASARPWTFWFWVDGNVSKAGIRADLEDMKRVGIGGAMLFDGSLYLPAGPLRYGTDAWHEHVRYAIDVAAELGLELGVMNCGGWATAGGPWVGVERSMKLIAWNETRIDGGKRVEQKLPTPPSRDNFYCDVALLAIPNEPVGDAKTLETKPTFPMAVTFDLDAPARRRAIVIPGLDAGTEAIGSDGSVEAPRVQYRGTIEASDDGVTFRTVGTFEENTKDWAMPVALPFEPTTARHFRISFEKTPGAAPQFRELTLTDAPRVANVTAQTGLRPMPAKEVDLDGQERGLAVDQIIDITDRLEDGTLRWDAPAGAWTILRIGYTTNAAHNHPAPPESTGYEVDKFDAAAVADHFEHGLNRILKDAGPHLGKSLTSVVSDSWEAGPQTWTAAMPAHFERLRGYDLRPYLACLTGRVVGTRAETDAFLRDFRKTIGDLVADAYVGTMSREAHKRGLQFVGEGYGGVFDEFKFDAKLDVPGVEFWNHGLYKSHQIVPSVAATTGKPIVFAEAFTSRPPDKSGWRETPAMLKPLGDQSFARGINRLTLHSYIHQPRSDIAPGFTHGRYGTHFGRLNTWWPMAGTWIDYLRRTQAMLQRGAPSIDLLYLAPESLRTEERDLSVPWPRGYTGAYLSTFQLANARVEDGKIRIGDAPTCFGMLVLPPTWTATIEQLGELKRLAEAGATIIGGGMPTPAGLRDFQRADQWDAATAFLTKLPTTRPATFLPDVECDAPIEFTHRIDGDADIYFVCNPTTQPIDADAMFRVTGREPELLDAVSGRPLRAAFAIGEATTRVRLTLAPGDSTFVLFRRSAGHLGQTIAAPTAATLIPIDGPWRVDFQPGRGAPASITLDRLASLSEHAEAGVKYFSGLATYSRSFEAPAKAATVSLDLGVVADVCDVYVNDTKVETLWRPPFVVDVTKHVRPGSNTVRIVVANRWVNRLIGDEQLPPEAEYGTQGLFNGALKAFPQWWNESPPPGRQRVAFSVWKHYDAKSPLVPSGLIGPVRLLVTRD